MRKYNIIVVLWAMLPILIACIPNQVPQNLVLQSQSPQNETPQEEIAEEEEVEEEIIVFTDRANLPISQFNEIWGYVISGREDSFKPTYPISDIGYFGAGVNTYGQLVGVPDPKKITNFSGKIHLVVVCEGQALSNFTLMAGSQVRRELIAALLEAVKPFHGLQIDFENVPARRGDDYRSFLAELRRGLPSDKMFTVALAARTRTLENDVYDYSKIVGTVDRILVMAYDEHWSGSRPGPIASMDWSRNVATYALRVIGPEKLVMGLPFYGRSWGSWNPNQAYIFTTIERIKEEQKITEVRRDKGVPYFSYTAPITATVYYEDDISLSTRLEMYRNMGVRSVGFWRVGQESVTIWNHLQLTQR